MVPIVLLIIAVNIVGVALIAFLKPEYSRKIAVFVAAVSAVGVVRLIIQLAQSGVQPGVVYIPYLNVGLSFGLTGVTAVLLLLSEIVIFVTAASGNVEKTGAKASAILMTLFQIAAVGIFTSQNLLLFFVFWDIGVIAMFFMINVLGGENRRAASINFLLYELFASSMLLIAIIMLYVYTPAHSLNIGYLISATGIPSNVELAVLISMFLAFMTNMAVFPFHFWLPDAYAEASTQGSMLLSGILTKFGGYGMLLMFGISGLAIHYSQYIAAIATVSVIYAALMLIRQKELKRAASYAAMLEMGIILLAIAAYNTISINGAVYGMFAQGISIALAFLAIGVIKSIFDESNIDRLRDVLSGARSTAYSFALAIFSTIGFPLTAGFIAELLIFFGAVQSFGVYGLIPLAGVLIMAAYFYSIISNCLLLRNKPTRAIGIAAGSQRFGFYALSLAIVALGILPFLLLGVLRL